MAPALHSPVTSNHRPASWLVLCTAQIYLINGLKGNHRSRGQENCLIDWSKLYSSYYTYYWNLDNALNPCVAWSVLCLCLGRRKKTWWLYVLQRHVQFTAGGEIFLQPGNEPLDTRPRSAQSRVWRRGEEEDCGSNYPHCTHSPAGERRGEIERVYLSTHCNSGKTFLNEFDWMRSLCRTQQTAGSKHHWRLFMRLKCMQNIAANSNV